MNISENIDSIEKIIEGKAKLVCVSKYFTNEQMEECYNNGLRDFGESKVEVFLQKHKDFHSDVRFHFIGHLQRNKVKKIIGKIFLIQSVDSIRLIEKINAESVKEGVITNILIQVNIGKDENKYGFPQEEINKVLDLCENYGNIYIKGLMTIIPRAELEFQRKFFSDMKVLFEKQKNKIRKNVSLEILSMGMTGDYKVAIENGSNMIRVGQGILK